MPNDTNGRGTPLRARGMQADRSPEDADWTKAATAPSRPKSATARSFAFRLLWAALGVTAVLLLIHLSFGKGRETVEHFENALNGLTRDVTDIKLVRAAADALSAELNILSRHAPHIVSADEEKMNRIEQVISAKEAPRQNRILTL